MKEGFCFTVESVNFYLSSDEGGFMKKIFASGVVASVFLVVCAAHATAPQQQVRGRTLVQQKQGMQQLPPQHQRYQVARQPRSGLGGPHGLKVGASKKAMLGGDLDRLLGSAPRAAELKTAGLKRSTEGNSLVLTKKIEEKGWLEPLVSSLWKNKGLYAMGAVGALVTGLLAHSAYQNYDANEGVSEAVRKALEGAWSVFAGSSGAEGEHSLGDSQGDGSKIERGLPDSVSEDQEVKGDLSPAAEDDPLSEYKLNAFTQGEGQSSGVNQTDIENPPSIGEQDGTTAVSELAQDPTSEVGGELPFVKS